MGRARQLIEQAIELFNAGDLERLTPMYAEDAVEITPRGQFQGRTAIGERLRAERAAFPDQHMKPLVWVEEGDTVVVEYTWTGTHTGPAPLPDGAVLPPTGEQLTLAVVSVFQLRGDETVAHRMYWDQLPAMLQLGVVTLPERPGEAG